MKRFLVFSSACYYPSGGWDDFHAAFDDLDQAKASADEQDSEWTWSHVVDLTTLSVVYHGKKV